MSQSFRLMSWATNTVPAAPVVPVEPAVPVQPAVRPMATPVSAIPQDTMTLSPATTPAWSLGDLQDQIASLSAPVAQPVAIAPTPTPVAQPVPAPAPKAEKPKAEKPKAKPKPKPEPKDDNRDEKYASKLRSHLHGKYFKTPTGCFRYAWNVVARSGGRSIGQATQSREGRGKGTEYLGQMVKDGRIKVGDIVYINRKPGADPTSTILSYKPHWFVYIGNGKFADQYGERDAAAMDRNFSGRKIDTIYRTN